MIGLRTGMLLLTGVLVLAACQSRLVLMPTPEVLKDSRFNLFAANPQPLSENVIATLYATTRVPAAPGTPGAFTGKVDDSIHVGYAQVRIGEKELNFAELIDQSTTGERSEKFAWSLEEAPILASIARSSEAAELPVEMQAAFERLNAYIDENPIKELTIYVHGANNTFYWSTAQGAQFQYFTGDNAMVLTYSWPSPGFALAYGRDKRRANEAGADLAQLVELLARHSTATRINLLAYSAGGRVVGRALDALGKRYEDPAALRLGQVYLCQSDQPLEEFVHQLPGYFDLLEGLTVTAAENDPVLGIARLSDGKRRLGAVGEGAGRALDLTPAHYARIVEIVNSDRMLLLDLQHVPAAHYRFTHGAWYDSSWVSTDVMVTLLGGYNAEQRALVPVPLNDVRVWTFPPDYLEQIKASVLRQVAREDAASGR